MSDLSSIERLKFEALFDMESGYVLDFSNNTFSAFTIENVGIDVFDSKYEYGSSSKANRLRKFWMEESNEVVGKLLSALLDYWLTKKQIGGEELSSKEKTLYDECQKIVNRLNQDSFRQIPKNTSSPPQKGRIFISYRRADSEGYAGRIYDRLVLHFGNDAIFMDVDDIPAGVDFVKYLENEVQSCDVLIALIGKQWLNVKDEHGIRRLDDPNDFVRIEIATALKRDVRVIPVLLGGTQMPNVSDLPENLQPLTRRNGLLVYHHSFHADTTRLIKHLEGALGAVEKERQRIANEKEDREAAEKADKEKAERKAATKVAKEQAEKKAAEKARLEAEEQAIQKAAKEKAEREAAEKLTREKAEKEAKEKEEREAAERAERERKEKELRENQVHEVSGKARNETEKKEEKFATGKPKTKNKLLYGFGGFVALIFCILLLSSLNKLLQNVATKPENTLTQTNISSTTAVNPSATSIIKITSTPTDELPPNHILTLTLEPGCKDNAIFVSDVTIPDGTTVSPSQVFVKTWRILNNGSCMWGEGYLIEHVAGEKMMGQALPLPNIVMPGESVDVSVRFTAPASTGEYTSDWQMVNVNGVKFGASFFIIITVK